MIISCTPLRISFAGGGSDLPSFYRDHDFGAVFSTSINKYIYVIIKDHCELYPEKIRLNYSQTEQVNLLSDIKNPIIRESLRFLDIDDNLYISTVADAPESSGLGSSSTFCVGLLNALYRFKNEKVNRSRLAEEAAHIEMDILKRPMGKQDHYAAAFGSFNYIRFNDDETSTIKPLLSSKSVTNLIFSNLQTFWTGIKRKSDKILSEQDFNNKENWKILNNMKEQALIMYEFCNRDQFSIHEFGELLHQGWTMKKTLASKISNSFISEAYETALANGALGGKISGAGGGGFLNLIVPSENRNNVKIALEKMGLKYFPIGPDSNGTMVKVYE